MGPAMLAILTRPQALLMHLQTMINKFSFVLTPTAGSLQGSGQTQELREFGIASMHAGWILAVLPSSYLFVLGDKVIDLWMGDGYGHWRLMAILAAGSVIPMASSSAITILSGLNLHGRLAKLSTLFTLISLVLMIPIVYFYGWTLETAALITVVPISLGAGILAVVIGCGVLKISARDYFVRVVAKPIAVGALCVLSLFLVRIYAPGPTWRVLLLGALVQVAVMVPTLWVEIRAVQHSLKRNQGE
jgi:O-antigen/teichoic acid export membrane protein